MEIMKHCHNATPLAYRTFTVVMLITAIQKQFGWGYFPGELEPWCIFLAWGVAYIFTFIYLMYQEKK